MKKKWKLSLLLTLVFAFMMQMSVLAAGETMAVNYCLIQGSDVLVIGSGAAQSDDGNLYLFALEPYETGIGARTNYCAVQPAGQIVQFTTPLGLNTANSKLYSRFVIAANRGGQFVPVSTEMYITNPEAAATASTVSVAEPRGVKKGLYTGWQHADKLSELGAGYSISLVNAADFFNGGGVNYVYNGKTYSFNASKVVETDIIVRLFNQQNTDMFLILTNGYSAANLDMIYPGARMTNKNPHYYAFNVSEQVPTEKLEAFVSFIASRYNGGMYGSVHNYIVGNEVNSSNTWYYAGEMSVEQFSVEYAKQFRVCYNAIKSNNMGANVYICTDQRWLHNDGGSSYGGKPVIDNFAAEIARTGNINWGLSFHPYSVPLTHTKFWETHPSYAALKLVNHTDNTKMIIPTNMDVVINHMSQPHMLAPSGAVRNLVISEIGFSSMTATSYTDEALQAAALVYSYKLADQYPQIKAFLVNSVIDNDHEVVNDRLAVGLMRSDMAQKPAYNAFKLMDVGGTDHFAAYIKAGATSWAALGLK